MAAARRADAYAETAAAHQSVNTVHFRGLWIGALPAARAVIQGTGADPGARGVPCVFTAVSKTGVVRRDDKVVNGKRRDRDSVVVAVHHTWIATQLM